MEDIDLDCVETNMYSAHTYKQQQKNTDTKTHSHTDIDTKTHSHVTSFVAMTLLVAGDNYKSPADWRVCEPK